MKEKIFEMSEHGPFRAKVDERFHKLGFDCPEDGWVNGYLVRDLHRGEVLPHIFNCPCSWVVQEETIEPVGFHIAEWIKVEDSLPEYDETVQVWGYWATMPEQGEWWASHRPSRKDVVVDEHGFAKVGKHVITHWRYVEPPKED